jgi:diguanylate cyclase (GGDEF)-like protein
VIALVLAVGAAAFAMWRTASRLRRHPETLATLVGACATASTMAIDILEPDLHTLVVGYLTIIPLASSVLLFWRPPAHLAALALFCGVTIAFVALAPGRAVVHDTTTVLAVTGVACLLSAFGNLESTLRRNSRARQARQLRLQRLRLRAIALDRAREARTDTLTGLGSRRALREDLAEIQGRLAASGQRTALVLADLDHFKDLNDRYGHAAGDDALERVGAAIRAGLRKGDVAYRYGGEEFLVLLEDASTAQAVRVVERIRAALDSLGAIGRVAGPWPSVTFSAGVAEIDPGRGIPVERALRLADRGLYEAKAGGRNRTVVERMPRPEAV